MNNCTHPVIYKIDGHLTCIVCKSKLDQIPDPVVAVTEEVPAPEEETQVPEEVPAPEEKPKKRSTKRKAKAEE